MPAYSYDNTLFHMRRVRRLLSEDVKMPILTVVERLKSDPHAPLSLDKNYVGKLMNKIRRERGFRIKRETVNEDVAALEDKIEEYQQQLWEVIHDPMTTNMEKINAIRELREGSENMLEVKFNAGIYERQLGKLRIEPLPVKYQLADLPAEEQEQINKILNYVFVTRPNGQIAASTPAAVDSKPTDVTGNVGGGEVKPAGA